MQKSLLIIKQNETQEDCFSTASLACHPDCAMRSFIDPLSASLLVLALLRTNEAIQNTATSQPWKDKIREGGSEPWEGKGSGGSKRSLKPPGSEQTVVEQQLRQHHEQKEQEVQWIQGWEI